MNPMRYVDMGAWEGEKGLLCVEGQNVRNIRNIYKYEINIQLIQLFTAEILFRSRRNIPEPAGTFKKIVFRHVPAMFRFTVFPENLCSLSATRPTAACRKIVFRHVPVAPEHFQIAGGPGIRGLQKVALAVFRMFRTFAAPSHVSRHNDTRLTCGMEISQ